MTMAEFIEKPALDGTGCSYICPHCGVTVDWAGEDYGSFACSEMLSEHQCDPDLVAANTKRHTKRPFSSPSHSKLSK